MYFGSHDGVLRRWINGRLAFEKADIRSRFDIYLSGSWTAPQDMNVYFDNVVIAHNYIGPCEMSAPIPPTNLQVAD